MADVRDSIRAAFKKQRVVEATPNPNTKWDSETQPNLYQLDTFLRKSGYRLIDVLDHKDHPTPELIIEPINPGYLYPEISHDYAEGNFYAKVMEHGMMVASDIEEIIKGYNNALGVLNYLDSLSTKKLEISPDEE